MSVIVYEHKNNPGRGGAVVSYPDLKVDFACDYLHEGHLASFIFIALSYKPAEQGAAQPATRSNSKSGSDDQDQPAPEGISR